VSELAHITVKKALRVLGFGMKRLIVAPVDAHGRIDPAQLPPLDDMTILCVQAGEVNTGEFDPFAALIPRARAAGAWVHVDGAFGLWARASSKRALTDGVDGADSWTTDGQMAEHAVRRRDGDLPRRGGARNRNEQRRRLPERRARRAEEPEPRVSRARGIPVWAALRARPRGRRDDDRAALRAGSAHRPRLARGRLRRAEPRGAESGARASRHDDETIAIIGAAQDSGAVWFGQTVWQGRPALRISVSSWRTAGRTRRSSRRIADAACAACTCVERPPRPAARTAARVRENVRQYRRMLAVPLRRARSTAALLSTRLPCPRRLPGHC
jgi:hypothetical protein